MLVNFPESLRPSLLDLKCNQGICRPSGGGGSSAGTAPQRPHVDREPESAGGAPRHNHQEPSRGGWQRDHWRQIRKKTYTIHSRMTILATQSQSMGSILNSLEALEVVIGLVYKRKFLFRVWSPTTNCARAFIHLNLSPLGITLTGIQHSNRYHHYKNSNMCAVADAE